MDVITFGPERRRPQSPRRLAFLGTVAVLAAALVVISVTDTDDQSPPQQAPSTTPTRTGPPLPTGPSCDVPADGPWESVAAMVIDGEDQIGRTLQSCDRAAADGPYAVVVRRSDGSLGRHGAVVTFPIRASTAGRTVKVGRLRGVAGDGIVTWPLAGAYARVRGDLDQADLVAIAARTTVASGWPVVSAPAGYALVSTGPYRSTIVRTARYGTTMLGEQDALGGGLTYTALADGAGIEDQFYAEGSTRGGLVLGKPSVVSRELGGNGALTWEPAPGLIAYVGYSGAVMNDDSVAALLRLANRTRVLTGAQWLATGPQTINQTNG